MSNRRIKVLFIALIVVNLFFSCENKVEEPKEPSTITTVEEEAINSLNTIGEVKEVIEVDSNLLLSNSRAAGIDMETLSPDESGVFSVFHLVYFSSLEKSFGQYTSECPIQYLDLAESFPWKPEYEGKVLIRSCYFESTSKPAYREAYFLDGYEEDLALFIVREVKLSPDYTYSIDAEIEIKTGLPKMYDWKSQSLSESNRYVKDEETDFGSLDGDISKAWKYVDAEGNLVQVTHSDARYIVEIDKESASEFMNQKLSSSNSDRLRIGNFIYTDADKDNKAYLSLSKYPDGYIHSWEIVCYWYEDGVWNYTRCIQTDDDFIPIWYKEVSISDFAVLKERISPLGSVTIFYQEYKGSSPYVYADGTTKFAVEFNETHSNLTTVAKNSNGYTTKKNGVASFGLLRKDTVGYAYVYLNEEDKTRMCILAKEPFSDSWYNSYSYLPLEKVGDTIRINGQDLDNPGYYDEKSGKYFFYSKWNGEKYWSEYEGAEDFEKTLSQLGTLESVQYFVGETGQTAPFITTFFDGAGSYISMLGVFSSFDEEALSKFSPSPFNLKYFTRGLNAYDIDLDSEKSFVELNLFFKEDGSLSNIQIRIMTNKENAIANGKEYATTYKLAQSFLVNKT